MASKTSIGYSVHAAVWGLLALAWVGCLSAQPPHAFSSDALPTVHSASDPKLSVRLGPRTLRAVLPLLVARSSPTAPLYLRHLDQVYLQIYESDGAETVSPFPPAADDVVLRIRDATSTVTLLRPPSSATLDRFYLLISEGDERIVAYAEGDFVDLVRQAFANSF